MTQTKIITKKNADFGEVALVSFFTVPAGQTFSPSEIVFKRGDDAPDFDGDGTFKIVKRVAEVNTDIMNNGDTGNLPGQNAVVNVPLSSSPILNAGDQLALSVTLADGGDDPICDIEVIGTISGDNVSGAGTPYTDLEAIEAYTGKDIAEADEDTVNGYILAMSMYIDAFCNRDIFREEVATYRYDGDGSDLLLIKDVCNITEVTVDGETRDVYTYPQNKPYASRIKLDGYKFNKGIQNVSVTGIQAMSAVLPADIKQACTVLVAGIMNAKDVQGKVGTTERIGAYSVTYKDEAQQTDFATAKASLQAYRRIAL